MSLSPIVMSLFLTLVGMLFFGSLEYTVESGTRDDELGVYIAADGNIRCVQTMVKHAYSCQILSAHTPPECAPRLTRRRDMVARCVPATVNFKAPSTACTSPSSR